MENKHYLLALNRIYQMGPRTIAYLLQRWPLLDDMFKLSATQLEQAGLSSRLATAITTFDLNLVEADWRWQDVANHHILTWQDPDYPALLKEIPDPPAVLYAKGRLDALQQPKVAMVGTRNPSVTGHETAWHFAHDLARNGVTIVSGLALGIDGQAHRGCLAAKGKTIAVMGTGIDLIYPYRHRQLADKICEEGLLLSEFPLKSPPNAGHFPRRNRIICGVSSVTLVVEAAIRSGSLITARLALEQNRDVLAIPGSIHNPQARGCHHLLQQGAKLVTTSKEVLEELRLDYESLIVDKAPVVLANSHQNLVKFIGFETTTVDQMIERSGLTVEEVIGSSVALELQGIIKAVPGGYMRCML